MSPGLSRWLLSITATAGAAASAIATLLFATAAPALATLGQANAYAVKVGGPGSLNLETYPTATSAGEPASADDSDVHIEPDAIQGKNASLTLRDVHADAFKEPSDGSLKAGSSIAEGAFTLVGPVLEPAPEPGLEPAAEPAEEPVPEKASATESPSVRMAESVREINIAFTSATSHCATKPGKKSAGDTSIGTGTVNTGTAEAALSNLLAGHPAPNTKVEVPGVDGVSMILNEQRIADDGTLTINAIHVRVQPYATVAGALVQEQDVVIGSVSCGPVAQEQVTMTSANATGWAVSGLIVTTAGVGLVYIMRQRRRLSAASSPTTFPA